MESKNETTGAIGWIDVEAPPDMPEKESEEEDGEPVTMEETHGIKPKSLNVITGMTGSGKTNLLFNIIKYNAPKFKRIRILCPTIETQPVYHKTFLKSWLYSNPTMEDIKDLFEEQKRSRKPTLWVLDDIIGVLDIHRCKLLNRIASSGRHYGLTVFILTQNLNMVGTVIRDNTVTMWITQIKHHCVATAYMMQSSMLFGNDREFGSFLRANCKDYTMCRFNLPADMDINPIVFKDLPAPKLAFR